MELETKIKNKDQLLIATQERDVRLKQEMGVDNGIYWKSSRENLIKISERLVRVSKQLKELGS